MPPSLNFACCFTGFIGGGLILHVSLYTSMCFKIMSKVVKYICMLRRYDYTHDQTVVLYILLSFFRIFFFGGGGAKFKFAPGRQLLSLRH